MFYEVTENLHCKLFSEQLLNNLDFTVKLSRLRRRKMTPIRVLVEQRNATM